MTTYYISGPMRGKPDYNREMFNAVEYALRGTFDGTDGEPIGTHGVINPSKNFGGRVDLPVADYMNLDLKQVLESDVIVQLPGWQDSEGAVREAQLAVWAGKRFMKAGHITEPDVHKRHLGEQGTWFFDEVPAPEFAASPRGSVLDEARQLITGDRNNAYGPPTQDFQRTADMASAFGFQVNGQPLASHHVAIFMILLKTSRLAWTPTKRDSWVDTGGYAGCGYECAVTDEAARLAESSTAPERG